MMLPSANGLHLAFIGSDMLVKKAKERIGPSTQSCDIPDVTASSSDHSLSSTVTTLWDLFFSKSAMQSWHWPFMP